MRCDTHIHSLYSFDGKEEIDKLCFEAVSKGIDIIAVTDHSEAMENTQFGDFEKTRLENQRFAVDAAREKYKNSLVLLYGCELGQPHLNPEYSEEILSRFDFDYVIGSLHYFKGNIDLYHINYTRENYVSHLKAYFAEIREMIEIGRFQALGHLDYILRRLEPCFDGAPTFRGFESEVEHILKMLVKRGIALEVNSSGLRNWFNDIGMESWVLELYKKLGGEHVTFGSDAHNSSVLGLGGTQALSLIKNAGFNAITYYKNKLPVLVEIT